MSLAAQDSGFTVAPISDVMGAEIVGLDVGQPFDTKTLKTIRDAFQTYHVLCFRDQHLTDEQMVAFSTQFGTLEEFPEKDHTKGKTEVYHVANVNQAGEHLPEEDPVVVYQRNNGRWHTDSSYRYIPSLSSILYGIEVLPNEAAGGIGKM